MEKSPSHFKTGLHYGPAGSELQEQWPWSSRQFTTPWQTGVWVWQIMCGSNCHTSSSHLLLTSFSYIFCLLGGLLWCAPAQTAQILSGGYITYIKTFLLAKKRLKRFETFPVNLETFRPIYDDFGWLGPDLRWFWLVRTRFTMIFVGWVPIYDDFGWLGPDLRWFWLVRTRFTMILLLFLSKRPRRNVHLRRHGVTSGDGF